MPKSVQLTIEIEVQRVSCPGVWLCQDGPVTLTMFTLGTGFQTCYLPACFPLKFKDVFYFRKKFQNCCNLRNIFCLLQSETIYCELVQSYERCQKQARYVILAQYLGNLNDVLFPPDMCSTEGVDLLMRKTKEFPGILSPKIEIATKLRLDEERWCHNQLRVPGDCNAGWETQPCDSAPYHHKPCDSVPYHQKPCDSVPYHQKPCDADPYHSRVRCSRMRLRSPATRCRTPSAFGSSCSCDSLDYGGNHHMPRSTNEGSAENSSYDCARSLIESRYVPRSYNTFAPRKKCQHEKMKPCVCGICTEYHKIFHK